MRRHILYVASESQLISARESLGRLGAETQEDGTLRLAYRTLRGLELRITMKAELSAIAQHLKYSPVDLLVYDERDGIDALRAVQHISGDVQSLADLWGSDFHFPMKRMVVILAEDGKKEAAHRSFALGRYHVKDVLVDQAKSRKESMGRVLRWLNEMLVKEIEQNPYKTGLALSGGGMEGFFYQVGATYALNQALSGRSVYNCELFSGVSSGSICASALANGLPLEEIIRSLKGTSKVLPPFRSSTLYDFAGMDIIKRASKNFSSLALLSPAQFSQRVLASIPTGFFKGEGLQNYVQTGIKRYNANDSFGDLGVELLIGTTHQDSFEHVIMGVPPFAHVKISDAVRASCALPPVFKPHVIDGQGFIDGQITRTCNLEAMVQRGCNLIFIIDPLLPYTGQEPGAVEQLGGLNTIIQTIKSLVNTRFRTALAHVTERYPDVDFIVFQPIAECAEVMSGSPMKLRANTKIIDLAYATTLRRLRERYQVYKEKLGKFNFMLKNEELLLLMEKQGLEGLS